MLKGGASVLLHAAGAMQAGTMEAFVVAHLVALNCCLSYGGWGSQWIQVGAAVQGREIIKNEGSRGGQPWWEYQHRGVTMMHGNTCRKSPHLLQLAISSFLYRSISDRAPAPLSEWRFISRGRSPQGSSHLEPRSLFDLPSTFPGLPSFLHPKPSELFPPLLIF